MPSAVLIANRGARQTAEELERARASLLARGVALARTEVAADHRELCRSVRRSIEQGHRLIVIAGGDGTMTAAVAQFAKSKAVMGVLPLGTGNSFALSLGIPDVETAVEAIAGGRIAEVDLGKVNGTYFANFATIGLSSTIAAATPNRLKKLVGPLAYVLAGILPGLRSRPFRCTVRAGKHKLSFRTFQAIVANGRYFGHTPLTPDAALDSRKLTFFSTSDATVVDAAKTYSSLLLDRQGALRNAHVLEGTEFRIHARPRQALAIDGEQAGSTPARFTIVPAALRIMVPASTPALAT